MKFKRLKMLERLVTCFLILLAVAVQRNGSVFIKSDSQSPVFDDWESSFYSSDFGQCVRSFFSARAS